MQRFFRSQFLKMMVFAIAIMALGQSSFATKQVVTVQNFSFTPSTFSINLGDTVQWVWVNGSHTTSSLTIPAGAASWNANMNSTSTTFTYVPAVTGTYNYQCNIHPTTMMGNFTVNCTQPNPTIQASGATTFCKGGSVTLSTTQSFTTYQWKNNGTAIVGATKSSLVVTAKGSYTCTVTNSCAAQGTSNTIKVTVNSNPKANIMPNTTQTICPPQTVTFTITVTTGATYQWLNNNVAISGATNTSLTVGAAGKYSCRVTSQKGCTKTSKQVQVKVQCREDMSSEVSALSYPNPFSKSTTINLRSFDQPDHINVYDLEGKLISSYQVTGTEMQIGENLQTGIYLARIEKNGEVLQTIKLIKTN